MQGRDASEYQDPSRYAGRRSSRRRVPLIAGISAAVAAMAVVVVLVFMGTIPGPDGTNVSQGGSSVVEEVVIDEDNFPDDGVREAVSSQLDEDGDGVLTPEQVESVTTVTYIGGQLAFGSDGGSNGSDGASGEGGNGTTGRFEVQHRITPDPGSEGGSGTGTDIDPIEDFEALPFPIRVLVTHDPSVRSIDMAGMPDLEYVDVRGTSVTELDLSGNGSLVSLFCDPTVTLTGLDDAGLFFEDLITSATINTYSMDFAVTYDFDALPQTVRRQTEGGSWECSYSYDDAGRCVRIEGFDGDTSEYAYETIGGGTTSDEGSGSSGGSRSRLVSFDFASTDELRSDERYEYEYDESGNLTTRRRAASSDQSATSGEGSDSWTTTYSYDDGRVSSSETSFDGGRADYTEEESAEYGFDGEGNLVTLDEGSQTASSSNIFITMDEGSIQYDPEGLMTTWTTNERTRFQQYTKTYSNQYQGPAISATTFTNVSVSGSTTRTTSATYETNQDGYVTKAQIADSLSTGSDQTITVTYAKHAGRMADREARSYVPRFSFDVYEPGLFNLPKGLNQYVWYPNTKDSTLFAGIVETDPEMVAIVNMGIVPRIVSNANEESLVLYDIDHWQSG